ncbi:MAG: hypothetical protein LBN95_13335, partial [Prevotellaceae bacterium]|nr:hypothetical protein [Prevotellaceae bacterium]
NEGYSIYSKKSLYGITIKTSAIQKGVTQQTSTPQSSSQQSSIQQFFPIYGVTLGQTTTDDTRRMGYEVKAGSNGTSNYSIIETIWLRDFDNDNVWETMIIHNDEKMPQVWINKFGFNLDLSYSEWLDLFKRMGFTIEINTSPQTTEYQGRNTLKAEFTALSPDKLLSFKLYFNYGNRNNEGYSIYSKKSLDDIWIKTSAIQKGVTPQSSSQQSSNPVVKRFFSDFFPIYGITLGQTTTYDVKRMGYEVEKKGSYNYSYIETIQFYDWDNDNVYEDMAIFNNDYRKIPQTWINKFGFNFDLSYSEWLDLFQKMGCTITINTNPQTTGYEGRNTLKAKFSALSPDKLLNFELYFEKGNKNNEGYSISSKKSLYYINVRKQ